MENHQIEKAIKPLLNKMWTYRKDKFTLCGYTLTERHIKLEVDNRPDDWVIDKADFQGIVDQFYPATNEIAIVNPEQQVNPYTKGPATPAVTTGHTVIGKNAQLLSEVITTNIKKLQEDPTFISQADAINNQLKTLIDLAKTEVDMLKAVHVINNR